MATNGGLRIHLKKAPKLSKEWGEGQRTAKNFHYIRSSYRIDPDFQVSSINRKSDILEDELRPKRMIDQDKRVQDNYERLVISTIQGVYSQEKDGIYVKELREELIGTLRKSMSRVFPDLIIEDIGDPLSNGQFFFTKGSVANFPYKNLSSGEKGAFDILLDLIIKTQEFNDTIIAIDEPDLHMHSSLQSSLLKEVYDLIPDECQLWIASHSIGIIRSAFELAKGTPDKVAIINFADKDFDKSQILVPEQFSIKRFQEILETAIDDLAYMVVPSTIVICEGSRSEDTNAKKMEFDAKIYNEIFADQDILFISGESKAIAQKSASLLLKIVKEAGSLKRVFSLVDKDTLTNENIEKFKSGDQNQKFLNRREIENYLFDEEILKKYCMANNIPFESITCKPDDITKDDIKPMQGSIKNQCSFNSSLEDFKLELARLITHETNIYKELLSCIQ
jgi:hypothetical protein